MTTSTKKLNAVTIWVFTKHARETGADRGAAFERLLNIFERGIAMPMDFGSAEVVAPVEFNLRPADAARAVAKWEEVSGAGNVLAVKVHKGAGDRFSALY